MMLPNECQERSVYEECKPNIDFNVFASTHAGRRLRQFSSRETFKTVALRLRLAILRTLSFISAAPLSRIRITNSPPGRRKAF